MRGLPCVSVAEACSGVQGETKYWVWGRRGKRGLWDAGRDLSDWTARLMVFRVGGAAPLGCRFVGSSGRA